MIYAPIVYYVQETEKIISGEEELLRQAKILLELFYEKVFWTYEYVIFMENVYVVYERMRKYKIHPL